jgi:hypothetical protein
MMVIVSAATGLVGVLVGALLSHRNARREQADRLLADALDSVVTAVADVAAGDHTAQRRYAAAVSRIVLHGSPGLAEAFRSFQLDATTGTSDGRRRFIVAVDAARRELGRRPLPDDVAEVLLFGSTAPSVK